MNHSVSDSMSGRPIAMLINPFTGEVTTICRCCGGKGSGTPRAGTTQITDIFHEPDCPYVSDFGLEIPASDLPQFGD